MNILTIEVTEDDLKRNGLKSLSMISEGTLSHRLIIDKGEDIEGTLSPRLIIDRGEDTEQIIDGVEPIQEFIKRIKDS
jgi:hypothetical protein